MVTQTLIIGTAEGCDIRIVDEYASSRHAQIFRDRWGRAWIRDLGSLNGTYVRYSTEPVPDDYIAAALGDVKVPLGQAAPLSPGMSIRIGRTWIPWTAR